MADFNSDNQKTDAALHGLAEQAAGKADAAALTAAVNRVSALENGKADQSALAAAVNRVSALENGKADQSALAAAVNRVSALENGKAEQSFLAAEQTARQNADSAEKAAREAADAALAKRAGAQLIRTETLTELSSYLTVPLDDIDWAEWRELHFIFQTASESVECYISFNGHSNMKIDGPLGQHWHVIACPCFTPDQPISGFVFPFAASFGTFKSDSPFREVTLLSINTRAGAFQPGTSATVWGVK